jgi:preprotein translocase subunit SecD
MYLMTRSLQFKWLFIVAVILICIYGIIGIPKSTADVVNNFKKNIRLGLDLRGGSQLVMQVQVQDAFKAEADSTIERLKDDLKKAGVDYASMDRNDPQTIQDADKIQINVHGVPSIKAGDFRRVVNDQLGNTWNLTAVNATDYRLNIRPTEALKLRKDTVAQTMNTIEKKINGLGLAESAVQQRGRAESDAEILVQLPGVDDPARIKEILRTAAMLELFKVVDGPFPSREEALVKNGGVLPLNSQVLKAVSRGGTQEEWYILDRTPVITGRDLRDAHAQQGELGRWETNFVLTQDAARRFERFTETNIGNRLAIVLDKVVLSAPTIQNKISDTGRITGAANHEEAADLALNLRAGSLPASVVYLEERSIGPALGADSIRDGIYSSIAGVIAVIIVMLIYYKRSGVNATLALVLNAIILIAALSYFDATLTLPGIAGVILTIGMAVDSNVLIFERIREELRAGKAVVAAVDTGFSRAFLTIIDTHVTTVVSCAFLFIFGTTAVKGFAVTLVIGLIANVFTAVFVSKAIFDWELSGRKQLEALSI